MNEKDKAAKAEQKNQQKRPIGTNRALITPGPLVLSLKKGNLLLARAEFKKGHNCADMAPTVPLSLNQGGHSR